MSTAMRCRRRGRGIRLLNKWRLKKWMVKASRGGECFVACLWYRAAASLQLTLTLMLLFVMMVQPFQFSKWSFDIPVF